MIKKLFIKPVKGEPPVPADRVSLTAGRGIDGDCHATGGDRQICFISEKTEDALNAIKDKYNCVAKFSPNIVFSGGRKFAAGDTISINDAVIKITAVGRECHQLCELQSCPLIDGIIFAEIIKSGSAAVGDTEIYA